MIPNTKIVVFCAYGNVRSNGVGGILKDILGYKDVIVAGHVTTSHATQEMLCNWADHIFVAGESSFADYLMNRGAGRGKIVTFLNIGSDRWGFGRHPDLVRTICNAMRDTGFANITPEMEARYLRPIMGSLRAMAKELE